MKRLTDFPTSNFPTRFLRVIYTFGLVKESKLPRDTFKWRKKKWFAAKISGKQICLKRQDLLILVISWLM
jgi:hypothetical protein